MKGIVNVLFFLLFASPCLAGGLSVLSYGFLGHGLLWFPEEGGRQFVVVMFYVFAAFVSFPLAIGWIKFLCEDGK